MLGSQLLFGRRHFVGSMLVGAATIPLPACSPQAPKGSSASTQGALKPKRKLEDYGAGDLLETVFYFAPGTSRSNKKEAIQVRALSLKKKIAIKEIMIREWVDQMAIEIIVNPKTIPLKDRGQTVNIKPVISPGDTPIDKGSKGDKLGTTPDIPIKVPSGDDEGKEGEISTKGIIDAVFGFNPQRDLNLPGGKASEGEDNKSAEGFGEAVGAIITGAASAAYKYVEATNAAAAEGTAGAIGEAVAIDAAATVFFEVVITAVAVASVANAVVQIWNAAKTPNPMDETDKGGKTPLPKGVRPSAIPVVKDGKVVIPQPATDNIVEKDNEPSFIFKQRNQAVDPTNPDQTLPEFGGDMIVVFTTSQGVTDPSRIIGTFN